MASPVQWTWTWANSRRQRRMGKPDMLLVHGVSKSQTQLGDWTATTIIIIGGFVATFLIPKGARNYWLGELSLTLASGES